MTFQNGCSVKQLLNMFVIFEKNFNLKMIKIKKKHVFKTKTIEYLI